MKHLIRSIVNDIAKSDEMQFEKYFGLRNNDGWKMHVLYLERLRLLMSLDLLSSDFTKLTPTEKDVQQRVYAGVNEVIDFLINPFKDVQKRSNLRAVETKARQDKAAFKPKKGATFGKPDGQP